MPLMPLDIPAGVYKNGTDIQAAGRWRDASLVRWMDGTMRPMHGWRVRSESGSFAPVRGMISWTDNTGSRYYAGGTYNNLYVWNGTNDRFQTINSPALTTGFSDAQANLGYGGGLYGRQTYGDPRSNDGSGRIIPATTWALQTWGQYLLNCNDFDGIVREWQLGVGNPDNVQVVNAPINNTSIVVTEERFLMCLGAEGNVRLVKWSDREDNTVWDPTAENEAGEIELSTEGVILSGVSVQGQTLILTTRDAFAGNYIGPPYVYGFERVGTGCGLAASLAYASTDNGCFWMGNHSFYAYAGGKVTQLQCSVSDYVFSDINRSQISKSWAMPMDEHGEAWFFYPSSGSNECNRYVVYNYVENTWYTGNLSRSAGCDSGPFEYPMMADPEDYLIYEHEVGFAYTGSDLPFAETGPIALGDGEQVMSVTKLIPDEKTNGDVLATFKTRFTPNGTERTYGPFTMADPVSMRFTGRQVRMRIEGTRATDWRSGINRLGYAVGGKR